MFTKDASHDVESEPQPGPKSAVGFGCGEHRIENTVLKARRDADAGVGDLKYVLSFSVVRRETDPLRCALTKGEDGLDGVRKEVQGDARINCWGHLWAGQT